MKLLHLVLPFIFCFSLASAQQVKKPVAKKIPAKKNIPFKVPFLKRSFLLDTAMFSQSSITKKDNGGMELQIKLLHIKTASISITDASASSAEKTTRDLRKSYNAYEVEPSSSGHTFNRLYSGLTILNYGGKSIEPLEYQLTYHGTKEQQVLSKSTNETLPIEKRVNKYSSDEKNYILRIYLLPNTPGIDKGFMMLYYIANSGEDKNNDGPKLLQTILDGISPMKINDFVSFSKIKIEDLSFSNGILNKPKYSFDMALPDSASGFSGIYSFSNPSGIVLINNIADATIGYAALVEDFSPISGEIKEKGPIEEHILSNGIHIFTRLLTMQSEGEYKTLGYMWVNVLVADKKIIKTPLRIVVESFSEDMTELKKMNTFILNSISLPGTLTKAAINLIKDDYGTADKITKKNKLHPGKSLHFIDPITTTGKRTL